MARNIEVKARVEDMPQVESIAQKLCDEGPTLIHQDDTFFNCDNGRLKLRDYGDGSGDLIFYRRPDLQGPAPSHYKIAHTTNPGSLRDTLMEAYGDAGRVIKTRQLYTIGRTWVHLDQVKNLGTFIELEVELDENEPEDLGMIEANDLMADFGIIPDQLVDCAYVDLMRP